MKVGQWNRLLLAVTLVSGLAGCKGFWNAPSASTTFALSSSTNISVAPAATTSNTSTITVTPASTFTGTVDLSCAISSSPSNAVSVPTCALSPTSVDITSSSATAPTSTLTATTTSTTTLGTYQVTVTGTSGGVTQTTDLCIEVSTTSATCQATSSSSGNYYILNNTGPEIIGQSIVSGTLTGISGSPWTVSGTPYTMAMAPNGNFLVVSTASEVASYQILSGVLQTAAVQSSTTGASVEALQVDQTSGWLVEASSVTGVAGVTLCAIRVNSTTGAVATSATSCPQFNVANATVHQLVISPDNKFVFVALGAGGTLVVPFDESNPFPSTVAAISPVIPLANLNAGSALSVAVDQSATPRLFYIGETSAVSNDTEGGLRAFLYANLSQTQLTKPTDISGSPFVSGGLAPNFILPAASSNYVYVANGQGTAAGNVAEFTISGSAAPYTITTGSTVAAGVQPRGLAEDSTGSYILAVGASGSPFLDAYAFDASTGQLTSKSTVTSTSAAYIAIVAAPPAQ